MEFPDFAITDIGRLRAEYVGDPLTDEQGDPIELFDRWLADAVAAGVPEPNAMALATATPDGQPSVRIVLLKEFDARGAVFFTGYQSRKGQELAANPRAAVTMLWHPIRRQVRIEGRVEQVDAAESDAYFASRPRGSQISAAASPQSQVVASREALLALRDDIEARSSGADVERPATWGGYRIALEVIEFWQGSADRFHDRLRFTATPSGWTLDRLAP